jgi:DNA polymerase bacteriophage-type
MLHVHVDFETRCLLDLPVVGLRRYTKDPSFEILLTGMGFPGDETPILSAGLDPYLVTLCADPSVIVHAFNAPFEQACLRAYGIDVPAHRWRCTLAHAYSMGFSGGLKDVGAQVGLPLEQQKLADGPRLVRKFCCPRGRTSAANKEPFWEPQDAPEDWERFQDYCRQDVASERAISALLRTYGPFPATQDETNGWALDREVDDRGMPVDTTLVRNALRVAAEIKSNEEFTFQAMTGGITSGQTAAVLAWCRERGYTEDNLQSATAEGWLQDPFAPRDVAAVLRRRLGLSQAAVAKFAKIEDLAIGGRVHGLLQMYGAGRTGRWSGRAVQLQNLKRPTMRDPDRAADTLRDAPAVFPMLYTLEDLGSLIRSAFCAPSGKRLVVADLASIESRVLGWVAGCPSLNAVFRDGRDPYKAFAAEWLGKPEEDVTKGERNTAKPGVLGCGYGLGPDGLLKYADSMGVTLDREQAVSTVGTFRKVYREIVLLWRSLEGAFRQAAILRESAQCGVLRVEPNERFTTIRLPSGRKLWYLDVEGGAGDLSFMGMDQFSHKWDRIRTYGARLVENVVQAIARDILLHGLLRARERGLSIVGHVHDEILCEEPADQAENALEALRAAMTDTPPWAPGLLLGAAGYVSQRYRKG